MANIAAKLTELRDLIADSVIWQEMVAQPLAKWETISATSGADRDDALAAVVGDCVYEDADYDEATTPPFILIRLLPDANEERTSASSFDRNFTFLMEIEHLVPTVYRTYNRSNLWLATQDGWNKVSGILANMRDNTSANRLRIDSLAYEDNGLVSPDSEGGEWKRVYRFVIGSRC